ncbi:MAG: 50S ribosomal protein L24 [Acidobacteria bacterium]|nr:50S ribosomal protein L24 [Acidobacteriota bacterium]
MARSSSRYRPRRPTAARAPQRTRLRKNDTVEVITGKDKGKRGRVLSVDPRTGRVLVEGVQMVKRHTRANPTRQIKGGVAERERPIAASNVMLVCSECGPVRIAHRVDEGGGKARRLRVCRKCGAPLDKKG